MRDPLFSDSGPGGQSHSGDGGDARQRLATEAQSGYSTQLRDLRHLAGGKPLEGQLDLRSGDAAPIVGDADEVGASSLYLDDNPRRTGVQRVLHQLLHDRRRALDHLACGDLRGDVT